MIELETIKQSMDCCRVHIRANGDAKVFMTCHECGEKRFCNKLSQFIENELIMRIMFTPLDKL